MRETICRHIATERIQVASAAFSLKHQRDLLATAETHLAREENSAVELEQTLLRGLRRHADGAARVLRQRRWCKVVQLFVLLPIEPSLPRADGGGSGDGRDGGATGAAVSGISTLMDLPLPNNGDYSRESCLWWEFRYYLRRRGEECRDRRRGGGVIV